MYTLLFLTSLLFAQQTLSPELQRTYKDYKENQNRLSNAIPNKQASNRPSCRINQYAYHKEYGFGFFVEKPHFAKKDANSCYFYNIKSHSYNEFDVSESESTQSCLTRTNCTKLAGNEGRILVSILCPPFNLNGQQVVGAIATTKSDIEVLFRNDNNEYKSTETKREQRNRIVRKSSYVVQSISKDYVMDFGLRDNKLVDLSKNPQEIMNRLYEEESGAYLTSSCDPNSTEPVPFFKPNQSGTGLTPLNGTGVMRPFAPPASPGAR